MSVIDGFREPLEGTLIDCHGTASVTEGISALMVASFAAKQAASLAAFPR
ncbi:MAG TPA: hypothetical protein VG405_05555 [Solirubrobacteraceae bacterium]|nr:hypothetical protein [Solirubrobacteraceae bacterium]